MSISRRDWLKYLPVGLGAGSLSGWAPALAEKAAEKAAETSSGKRAVILLWMTGGPSQLDTFDMKPGHENGGPFDEIDTDVPGIKISEHLPQMASRVSDLAVIRSMKTKEGDHARATYLLRTGYLPEGPVKYPTLGSVFSKELGKSDVVLPNFVSIAPLRAISPSAWGPGFLGPRFSPLVVGNTGLNLFAPGQTNNDDKLTVSNLSAPPGVSLEQADARLEMLASMESDFRKGHPGASTASHQAAYSQAVRMMRSDAKKTFDLDEEPDSLRDAYGRSPFGQGCLLARRLVERGVPFVEVSLNGIPGQQIFGWDTHINNFDVTRRLSEVLDPAWASLLRDLKDRGMLDSTLVVWAGEFGRTPTINGSKGRDHFPAAWTTVLAGGGVRGGQTVGKTSDDGASVEDRPVSVPDLLATVTHSLGIDSTRQNLSNVGRPIRIVNPEGTVIQEVVS